MKGPEYIREALRTHLEAVVPVRLAVHLAEIDMTSPDPAGVSFLLADSLQGVETFPCVVVRSPSSRPEKRKGDAWWWSYELELIVACDHRVYGDAQGASQDRDRLLTAVRESVLMTAGLTDDIDIAPASLPEDTGPASETREGLPLAAGTLRLSARVLESLSVAAPSEVVGAVDQVVTPVDASQSLPA